MAPSGRHSIAIAASSTRRGVQELNAEPPGGSGAVAAGPASPRRCLSFYRTRQGVCPGYRASPVMAALDAVLILTAACGWRRYGRRRSEALATFATITANGGITSATAETMTAASVENRSSTAQDKTNKPMQRVMSAKYQ